MLTAALPCRFVLAILTRRRFQRALHIMFSTRYPSIEAPAAPNDFVSRVASKITQIFGIDLRTLALFRVCLALIILLDLALRARDLTAHYSDYGVLPRAALLGDIGA